VALRRGWRNIRRQDRFLLPVRSSFRETCRSGLLSRRGSRAPSRRSGPVDTIFHATDLVAVALSDEESAAIAAGVDTQHSAFNAAMGGANVVLNGQDGNGARQVGADSFGSGFGGSIADTIGTATNAIGSALAPLSSVGRPE
jgi:hypothetical protein